MRNATANQISMAKCIAGYADEFANGDVVKMNSELAKYSPSEEISEAVRAAARRTGEQAAYDTFLSMVAGR